MDEKGYVVKLNRLLVSPITFLRFEVCYGSSSNLEGEHEDILGYPSGTEHPGCYTMFHLVSEMDHSCHS
jgi:hypothetical protein